jgi:hypothetical protein
VQQKCIRARRMGLLHLIGDCPDFINRTYSVSYGPCWHRASLLPRGFPTDRYTHGTVLAFTCAEVGAIAVLNANRPSQCLLRPYLGSIFEFRPECAARGSAPGLASLR